MTPVSATDFSGGFTDYYVGGPFEKCRRNDNFLINRHGDLGKLITRPGSVILADTAPQLPTGNQRVGTIAFFNPILLAHSKEHFYYLFGGVSWQELIGPTGNTFFPASTLLDTVVCTARWNKHLFVTNSERATPTKIFINNSGNPVTRTAGLPALASTPTAVGPGALTWIYKFIYEYTYTADFLTFLDLGPSVEFGPFTTGSPAGTLISGFPTLANGSILNYDTANIKIGIYRTISLGAVFYKVAEIANGTATYNDTTDDMVLVFNQPLYTEGGVVENDPPPLAKLVHVLGDVGYWADIQEGSDIRPNRVRQSIPGDLDSVPGDFFVDIDDTIIGMSSANGVLVLLGDRSAWRVDGVFDELGRGEMVAKKISDTCSCISSQSVVQTLEGVFWAGGDGFYYTDGFNVLRLNEDWDKTYASLAVTNDQKRRIQGKYDPIHRRIWWSVQSGATDCDASVVLDLNFGVRPRASFSTCSGKASWAPTAIEFIDGDLIRGDRRGYVFAHDDDLRTDPLVDLAILPANWQEQTIIYDFISCAYNFGTDAVRKYCTWFTIQCANRSNLSLQPISINDDGRVVQNLQPIRFKGNTTWGDPSIIWGDPTMVWDRQGIIEVKRRFPAKSLRCSYKQIELTNSYSVIETSDLLGLVDIDATAKTATLLADTWPLNYPGYFIAFAVDLAKEYAVVSVTGAVLTYSDVSNRSTSATGQKFQIKGYPKNEILDLLSMTIWYDPFGTTQEPFHAADLNTVSP